MGMNLLNRRTFVYSLAGLALAACDRSCDRDSVSGPDPTTTGPVIKAPSPIGYSNVAVLSAADVNVMAAAGLTLVQAEMIPFVGRDGGSADWKPHFPRIKAAVQAARAHGMTSFLTLVNWNGHQQREQPNSWFEELLDRVIHEIGPSGVWLEGVSEPSDINRAKAERWMRLAIDRWPGLKVANGKHGPLPRGYDLVDWHYCSYRDLLDGVKNRSDRLHSTDCTPALASNLNENEVKEVTREAIQRRRKLILYDTFNTPSTNLTVIRWMGEVLKEEKEK